MRNNDRLSIRNKRVQDYGEFEEHTPGSAVAEDLREADHEWNDDQEWGDWECEPVQSSKQVQATDEIIRGDIYCSNYNGRSPHGICNVCKFASAQKRAREYRESRNDRKRRRVNDKSWHGRSFRVGTLADVEQKNRLTKPRVRYRIPKNQFTDPVMNQKKRWPMLIRISSMKHQR